ncbi:MAG: N-acetyltransferase family protein [Cocleimonas sp.]
MIRPVSLQDAKGLCEIYNHYVENTAISFEEDTISTGEMEQRIQIQAVDYPWFVYELNGIVVAFAYASLWKTRSAYRFTLETTIYLSSSCQGKGIGSKLYKKLFDELVTSSVRSAMAVIALPNVASIALHEKMGFVKVAHFKEVGYKHKQWIDVGYWQKMFD